VLTFQATFYSIQTHWFHICPTKDQAHTLVRGIVYLNQGYNVKQCHIGRSTADTLESCTALHPWTRYNYLNDKLARPPF
jgi:hypothetical protein